MISELKSLILLIAAESIFFLLQFLIGLGLLLSDYIDIETFKTVNVCWLIASGFSVMIIYIVGYIIFNVMGA